MKTHHVLIDFHIAFYLGALSREDPDGCFSIISKDSGADPTVPPPVPVRSAPHKTLLNTMHALCGKNVSED